VSTFESLNGTSLNGDFSCPSANSTNFANFGGNLHQFFSIKKLNKKNLDEEEREREIFVPMNHH
jgi:hypothetical protein